MKGVTKKTGNQLKPTCRFSQNQIEFLTQIIFTQGNGQKAFQSFAITAGIH